MFTKVEIFSFLFFLVPEVSCYLKSVLDLSTLNESQKRNILSPCLKKIPASGLAESKSLYAICLALLFFVLASFLKLLLLELYSVLISLT